MSATVREYNTIAGSGEGEITEKKSRFIATVNFISSEEEAMEIIAGLKKQYWDARHNCYAFIVGKGSEIMRFSDDGEPSGTAGKPILEVLKSRELTNILVVVTRYFGGVLLGTGGLVRAYTDATVAGLNNCELKRMVLVKKVGIRVDYNTIGKLKYTLANNDIMIVDEEYTDMVNVKTALPVDEVERVLNMITDVTAGKASYDEYGEGYEAFDID